LQATEKRLKFGIVWENGGSKRIYSIHMFLTLDVGEGIVPPSPACHRALSTVISALRKQGHEVVDLWVNSAAVMKHAKVIGLHLANLRRS
jgi:Asp-tRNA(Asn)/Glu-tRNA(Gln) amidotransferase A subunit family amidase